MRCGLWINHFTPETKRQLMHWGHNGSLSRSRVTQTVYAREKTTDKQMAVTHWLHSQELDFFDTVYRNLSHDMRRASISVDFMLRDS
ncbi:hypothetical protein NPIL_312981 [Nephila pilipes]|uniref:Uncharacterized protein n=1 Tax=Nephila pilipes TaxID=299642 RepID=A0A8X6UL43_NEPPI|nr:hypothetical protein NPIL_312981 [Nephila pilipes]